MKRRLLIGLVLCGVLAGAWWLFGRFGADGDGLAHKRHLRPLTVEITHVAVRPMPLRLQAVGQVESEHVVQIRPQVSGELKKVAFTEGDEVKAGQLLFQIDPAPFEAALAQAQAALARDQATLAKARWQQQRTERLAKRNYVTPQDLEDARAAAKVAAAAVAVDRAAVMQARIQLRYTDIRSPITGRTGAIAFKAGNLVEANSATPLVTINQIAPIRVRYSIPQARLAELRRYEHAGSIRVLIPPPSADGPPAPASRPPSTQGPSSMGADSTTAPSGASSAAVGAGSGSGDEEGRLVFIDNTVDPLTGTVMLKAQFANKHRLLWPGQYVNVHTILTVQRDALVVPDSAVQPAQRGSLVYVVKDGRVHAALVQVARQLDGWSVIARGLSAGQTIVAKLPRNLRNGRRVKPIPEAGGAPAPAAHDRHDARPVGRRMP